MSIVSVSEPDPPHTERDWGDMTYIRPSMTALAAAREYLKNTAGLDQVEIDAAYNEGAAVFGDDAWFAAIIEAQGL